MVKKYFVGILFFLISSKSFCQNTIWTKIDVGQIERAGERKNLPTQFSTFSLNLADVKSTLLRCVNEDLPYAFNTTAVIFLPMPDGSFQRFHVAESNLLPGAIKKIFPHIRTFTARGIDDPTAYAKLDYTQFGFHAMVLSSSGSTFIDPFVLGDSVNYICYDKRYSIRTEPFLCETEGSLDNITDTYNYQYSVFRSSGTQLRTYRLALACTGEYAAFYGGTTSGAASGMVTSANRVSGVYEIEVDIRLTLIANFNLLIYLNSATDPYTNNNGSTMLTENQNNITTVIGSANYDIGHVFSTGGGGIAQLQCVCSSTNKSKGVTGSGSPIGDNFDIDYVAHEMGHQFGGNHTFNSILGSCSGNRASTAAYEVGSGTTIMAYAGICSTDNTQPHSDAVFHSKSYDEILTFSTTGNGNTCPVTSATGNNPPVINPGNNYTIPFQTPFILTGSATDPEGDALTYYWEQYDLGAGSGGTINAASTTDPIFRDFVPLTIPSRTFPKLSDIVNNVTTFGEVLPTVARSLNFKFTARDNKAGGGGVANNATNVVLTVVNSGTPFKVTNPNTAITWITGTTQTVTWDVSGTNTGSVNCTNVNIRLSNDGGFTYPFTLATAVPNSGSATVTVPSVITSQARVKVEGAGNIFFDISNVNFSIISGSTALTLLTTSPLSSNSLCAGATVSVSFTGDGPPNNGNTYSVQLSNSSGSFSNSVVTIGSLASISTSGTISCVIPSNTAQGILYRVRVISSNPIVTGSDNGSNISIYQSILSSGVVSGSSSVCQGQTGVVFSTPAILNATAYAWSLPSGASITSGVNTNSITVTFSGSSVSGSITVTGSNPCSSSSSSSPFAVTVNMLPASAGTISGVTSICSNRSSTFSIPAIANATGYSWTLPVGASIVSGANTNSVLILFAAAGTGTLSVAASNVCGSGASSSLGILVNPSPTTPVVTPSGPLTLCSGNSIALAFSAVSGTTYQWQNNNADILNATTSPYSANSSGNYSVLASLPYYGTQTFTNATAVSITDNSCTSANSSIAVAGYSSAISTSQIQVQINITHTWDGDLVIVLQAPNGSIIGLSNQTGNTNNSGDNFTNTIFSDAGSGVLPTTGAPYSGIYKPVATTFTVCTTTTTNVTSFGAIGAGSLNPNGTWTLKVFDRASADVGTLNNWSLILPVVAGTCTSASNVVAVAVQNTPTVSTFAPTSGSVGTQVTINGSGFTGTTLVSFNGTNATFTVANDTQIITSVPSGATSGFISITNACGSTSTSASFTAVVLLNLKVIIEGFYRGNGQMVGALNSLQSDSIRVRIATANAPYSIVASSTAIADLNGNCTFSLPANLFGNSYYLIVNHRNSLETWTNGTINFFAGSITFDFTTSASNAYGNNLVNLGNGVFGLRSGDVNQDGMINLNDISICENQAKQFLTGYKVSDLNGDSVVESADCSLLENNVAAGYSVQKP